MPINGRNIMRRIGLLGGMSYESSLLYYKQINQHVIRWSGGHSVPEIVLFSVNFSDVVDLMHSARWDALARLLIRRINTLISSGCDLIGICCNSAHKVFPQIQNHSSLPVLHILDATGRAVMDARVSTVGILGTRFVMEDDFYSAYLHENFGLDCIIPEFSDRKKLHQIIYGELCHGIVNENARNFARELSKKISLMGAQGVVLGCTELALLFAGMELDIEIFDTTQLHARTLALESMTPHASVEMQKKLIAMV